MKILAFGEVMMRMMPSDYKTLTQVNELEFLFTGTGVNILSGLYQMGEDVSLLTRLPDNAVGKAASANIRKLGINDHYIVYGDNHIGIYFLEKGIGNRASQVTYLNRKDSSFGHSQLSDYDLSCLDGQDALHICGISLAMNNNVREVAFKLAKEAKRRGIKVIFDCNFRPSLWKMCIRDRYIKSLGRLCLIPGIFNINEPVIFGAPIVMNPILAIPFIVAPIIMTIVSYLFTVSGLVPLMMAKLPFTLPAPLAAVMSTDWSIMAGVLVIINFIIALVIYYPFFKMFEKQQLEKEEASLEKA